ncbi:MAG: glutamate-5-semialdehyde dehydrogenase [Caulobacteraceae bacterium]
MADVSLLAAQMHAIGQNAQTAAALLRQAGAAARTEGLKAMARRLRRNAPSILEANRNDAARARSASMPAHLLDRLLLDDVRLEAIAVSLEAVAAQPDPVGAVISEWRRPNGLAFQRVRVPIGVIGMIFESRPNVAAEAAALALRSANAIILRGGSDGAASVTAIVSASREAIHEAGLPENAIQVAPNNDRAAVGMMLAGLDGAIDVIVPRGGKSLVARVQEDARVPVFAHFEGVCHTYVHADADPAMAIAIVLNAKMRRVSVCGATETLLIDRAIAPRLLPLLASTLTAAGCSLRGDDQARAIVAMDTATESDWRTEYLAPILAVRVVDGLEAAIAHIAVYGSQHTDSIVTEDHEAADTFLRDVDSAIVLHNASTQFADGGEFGFGAEIGIATGRLHARGPVGAEQLTTFKYVVRGDGQTRG